MATTTPTPHEFSCCVPSPRHQQNHQYPIVTSLIERIWDETRQEDTKLTTEGLAADSMLIGVTPKQPSSAISPRSFAPLSNGILTRSSGNSQTARAATTSAPNCILTEDNVDLVAEAMNQMSVQEREHVYNDVHGIVYEDTIPSIGQRSPFKNIFDEDPTMIKNRLTALKAHIQRYLNETKGGAGEKGKAARPAYTSVNPIESSSVLRIAMEQNSSYITNESFLLSFLRANEWDSSQAFDQLIRFLMVKAKIFSVDKLTKDIKITDLDDDDIECLTRGEIQYVPIQDRSGRSIICGLPQLHGYKTHYNLLRSIYYVLMTVSQNNIGVQQRGLVTVFYGLKGQQDHEQQQEGNQLEGGGSSPSSLHIWKDVVQLRKSLPIKAAAIHFCHYHPTLHLFFQMAMPLMTKSMLARVRMHCGSHVEVMYSLKSLGIPVEALPICWNDGQSNNHYHELWVQDQFKQVLENEGELKGGKEQWQNVQQTRPQNERHQSAPTSMSPPPKTTAMVIPPSDMDGNRMTPPFSNIVGQSLRSGSVRYDVTSNSISCLNAVGGNVENCETENDSAVDTTMVVLCPTVTDCLLGRGKAFDQHVGNVQLRKYLQSSQVLDRYMNTPRGLKSELADEIIKSLTMEHGVRFLKQNLYGKGWSISNDHAAIRHKIIRTLRRFASAVTNNNSSSTNV